LRAKYTPKHEPAADIFEVYSYLKEDNMIIRNRLAFMEKENKKMKEEV